MSKGRLHSLARSEESRPVQRLNTATPSSVRDVNRSILLNLIRLRQPISRVELSALTGIARSNVSVIVDSLIDDGLVFAKRATPMGRGRVPSLLYLKDDGCKVVGVNIRLSETIVAVAGLSGQLNSTLTFLTPPRPRDFVRQFKSALQSIENNGSCPSGRVREIGISVPGFVPQEADGGVWLPELPGYSGFPLAREIENQTEIPTRIDNDCNLAALAQFYLAEREVAGLDNFIFVEVGDVGVGGGIIVDRQLYRGHNPTLVAEFGHMVITPAGPRCTCGRDGCWEQYICDRATWRRYRPSVPFETARFGDLMRAARNGEAQAVAACLKTAQYLSIGITNLAFIFTPEAIIIAGEITQVWDLIREPIERSLAATPLKVVVRAASCATCDLFLQGAISLALRDVFAAPSLGFLDKSSSALGRRAAVRSTDSRVTPLT